MNSYFVALELSIDLTHRLIRFQESFEEGLSQNSNTKIVLTNPENIHATLVYFGELEGDLVSLICERLDILAKSLFPFEIFAEGVDAFPNVESPRVLWAGFEPKSAEVVTLVKRAVEKEMEEIGLASETKKFVPHITLGRFRALIPEDMSPIKTALKDHRFGNSLIRELILFESNDAGYSVIDRFSLGKS